MREGTTQPTVGEVSEGTDPMPERAETRGHALFAPSNGHDAANKDPETEGLTVSDFSNLVRFSSAAIGCISFTSPVSCDVTPEAFADLLYSTPSRCLQASVSLAHNSGLTSPDHLIGKPLSFLLPESRGFKQMLSEWRRRNLTREGFECEVLDLAGHPSVLHVALYGHIEQERLYRLWIVTRDISALSRAIRSSSSTERHYRELLNQEGLFFFRTHLDGTISFCTPSTQDTLLINASHGGTLEEVLERACHPNDRPALEQLSFHRRSLAQHPLHVSLRLLSRDRGLLRVTLHQTAHVISGEVDSYDVLGIEKVAAVDASENTVSKDTLAAGFAHDVNNQLIVASATIELAGKTLGEDHPAMEFLRTALHAVSQSAAINSQTLRLASGIHRRPVSIELNELFRDIVDQCDAILPPGIALLVSPSSPKLSAWVDETHIRQILLNLIINARDALRESGMITLSATPKRMDDIQGSTCEVPTICISVSDNGPGIDEAIASTLFTPFVSTKSQGTPGGLGLTMVKALVEENGGSISVTSACGLGTTFTVCLPTPRNKKRSPRPKRASPTPYIPRKHVSVLIADDEPEVRRTLMTALTTRGHRTFAVPDLASLRKELSRTDTSIDIVLLDGGMAEDSLQTLLAATRRMHPQLKVLITSGDPAAYAHIATIEDGHRFLPKPFSLSDLYDAVESTESASE